MERRYIFLIAIVIATKITVCRSQSSSEDSSSSGRIEVFSGGETGSFRKAMEAENLFNLGFLTNGQTYLGEWKLEGRFGYRRRFERNILFSGISDPYNGNPFLWGDTLSGNWQRDAIRTQVSMTLPAFRNWTAGLALDYATSTGARLSEPKPFFRYRYIRINPTFQWDFSEGLLNKIILELSYSSAFEENEIGYSTVNNTYLIRGRGYGSAIKGPIRALDRRRNVNIFGIQLNWTLSHKWKVDGSMDFCREEVSDGIANPQTDGLYSRTSGRGLIAYNTENVGLDASIDVHRAGTEDYAYGFENWYHNSLGLKINMDFGTPVNDHLSSGISLSFLTESSRDHIVDGVFEFSNVVLSGFHTISWNKLRVFFFIGYQYNLNANMEVGNPDVLNRLIYGPDFFYRSVNYLQLKLAPRIDFPINGTDGNHYWVEFENGICLKDPSSARYVFAVTLGSIL